MKKVHVVISGRVQGVFFRASTKQQADSLNLKGWVRNTKEGKVEAVFQGDGKKINQMLLWCHKGPRMAQVDDVEVSTDEYNDEYDSFSIRY